MNLFVITLAVLTISKGVVPRELHPEGEAAKLFGVEEDIVLEPDAFVFDQTNDTSVNDTWLDGYEDANSDNAKDIKWFKDNIVDKYGFQKMEGRDMWKKQGNFGPYLKDQAFLTAASRAKEFFKRNNKWETTKNNPEFRDSKSGKCLALLYITAARYLFVTHVLMAVSGETLASCGKDGVLNKIPPTVCYPEPYGTASCTSDYDVGLIGKDSGSVTAKFNNYFQDPSNGFNGDASELVFDTNVYAFTLEYAMPSIFSGLPLNFENQVVTAECTINYQMQELASSYYKVFKYNEDFANQLSLAALSANPNSPSATALKTWNSQIEALNSQVALANLSDNSLRATHNNKYQELVGQISTSHNGYGSPKESLAILAKALLYAAEAYHTRGAIRHVVGGSQMKLRQYETANLPLNDLWVSMIENWGETYKEYIHCEGKILEECLLKMSKYMWRMFAAMKELRNGISAPQRGGLVSFAGLKNPEEMMSYWLDVYKRRGVNKVSSNENFVKSFFLVLDCPNERLGQPLSYECMQSINNKVNIYNKKMADPKIKKTDKQNKCATQNDPEHEDYYDKFIDEIMQN